MKKYKDITIYCGEDSTALQELVKIESACIIPEFRFDEAVEKMYEPDDKMAHILVTIPKLPQAVLLVWASEGKIKVINIVPFNHSTFRIEIEDYNRIIDEFYSRIVLPTIGNRYMIEITSGDYTLEEIIPNSVDALNRWVHSPGAPNAPFSHQLDLERWFDFLCQMIRNKEELESGKLEQWLREEIKWPDDIIDETILKYEEEIDLLDYYVNRSR
ncbi:MAG: hypothetical protein IJU08_05375 [Bacteroidales bacterium]|nr:hypothetical protein [Bacteroidales bacterium]